MSVYTVLSLTQIQTFAALYELDVVAISPIQGGIENTNYFLTTTDNRQYVLTVFEEIDRRAVEDIVPVLKHLDTQGVPVAVPLSALDGQVIGQIADKPAQIAPRLTGQHPLAPTLAQAAAMGMGLARLHSALVDFPLQRQNTHNQQWWRSIIQRFYPQLSAAEQQLLDELLSRVEHYQQQYPERPRGLIHADVFRDNTLFEGDRLTAILDFSELNDDEWLLDIAITLNDFCTDYPTLDLNQMRMQAFLSAYQTIRPMTDAELQGLPLYLAMAASRFWLMRLEVAERNQLEGRTGSDILQKNPNEMREMLRLRLGDDHSYAAL